MTTMTYPPARRASGFTLIEVLITMVIIAILAAIAIPGYGSYVRKAHRADAQQLMMDMAVRQGEVMLDSRSYLNTADLTARVPVPATVSPFYDISVNLSAAGVVPPTFEIVATAKSGQTPDGNLKLKSDGTKEPAAKW